MLVRATRTLSDAAIRGLILAALFVIVVVGEISLSSALTALGISANLAFGLAGLVVLATVLALNWRIRQARSIRAAAREAARRRQGLPEGPCCLLTRGGEEEPPPLPWGLKRPIRARYPALARRLRVEGYALAAFEIGLDGRAKSVRCVEAWPSEVFFRAAAAALKAARFRPPQGAYAELSATYQLPFVFRIAGAGKRAGPLAAWRADEDPPRSDADPIRAELAEERAS